VARFGYEVLGVTFAGVLGLPHGVGAVVVVVLRLAILTEEADGGEIVDDNRGLGILVSIRLLI
jgi:hypothetical protein